MRILETTAFKFEELSAEAQAKAIEELHDINTDYEWWDMLFEDVADIAELFGLDIRNTRKEHKDKTFHYDPTIYFSGFWSQGDGACFEGKYSYQKGGLKAVMEYAPKDEELHGIVKQLQDLQRKNFYRVVCHTKQRGHYNHSGCMEVDVRDCNVDEDDLIQALREFADWIYEKLSNEHDYLTDEKQVVETILANEYEFTACGDLV